MEEEGRDEDGTAPSLVMSHLERGAPRVCSCVSDCKLREDPENA